MLVQYCVRPEVEIILFAIIAVKHLISHWTFFHTNIPALGFKRWGEKSSIKITLASVRKNNKWAVCMLLFVVCNLIVTVLFDEYPELSQRFKENP